MPIAVHPRACGEHTVQLLRARHADRFIPAHAGNTHGVSRPRGIDRGSSPRMRGTHVLARSPMPWTTVHPRACGEHAEPRSQPVDGMRFIPAHAGNTSIARMDDWTITGSSPRMRGTRACCKAACRTRRGSSPRMRGTRHADADGLVTARGSSPRMRGTQLGPVRS